MHYLTIRIKSEHLWQVGRREPPLYVQFFITNQLFNSITRIVSDNCIARLHPMAEHRTVSA